MARIPPNAADVVPPANGPESGKQDELEFELLEAERALRRLLAREVGQRYWLRWIAVGTGGLVILGMTGALWHLVHNVLWGPFVFASLAFSVAIFWQSFRRITLNITVTGAAGDRS